MDINATVNLTASGQCFELPLRIAGDDKKLMTVLTRACPQLAEAEIKRITVDEKMIVSVTARPDTKGAPRDVAEALRQTPEQLNPIIEMHNRLDRMEREGGITTAALLLLEPQIVQAARDGEREAESVKKVAEVLRGVPATSCAFVPIGF